MVQLHVMVPEELHSRFKSYFQAHGQVSRVIRLLMERQLRQLDRRTAEILAADADSLARPTDQTDDLLNT